MLDFTDLNDTRLYDPAKWYYDPAAGEEPIGFIEEFLDHYESQHAGKRFLLEEKQKAALRAFYGVKSVATRRDRFRYLFWETAKGCGKSPLAAGLGLYHLHRRRDPSPLIQNMAATYEQAEQLFERAKVHTERSKILRKRSIIRERVIHRRPGRAKWKIKSSSRRGKSGSAPSILIFDELHELPPQEGEMLGVLMGNLAKRHNSKCVILTNAGTDKETPCGEWHDRAMSILSGEREEEDVLPIVWAADEGDDISSRETWLKACPLLGITISEEEYEKAYKRTIGNKGEELKFRRFWLTQWTKSAKQVLDPADLAKCLVDAIGEDVRKLPRWDGLDVGPVDDITAVAHVWADREKDLLWVDVENYIPAPAADQFEKSNGVPYWQWMTDGYIRLIDSRTMTPGDKLKIAEGLTEMPKPELFCYDRLKADDIVAALEAKEWTCEPIQSTAYGIGQAMVELQRRVKDHSIRFLKNDCTLWQLLNLGCVVDRNDNALPMRVGGPNNNPRKIDACLATLYAMARAILYMVKGDTGGPMKPEELTPDMLFIPNRKPSKK